MFSLTRLFALLSPTRWFEKAATPKKRPRKPDLEQLESRLVFDNNPGHVIGVFQPPQTDPGSQPAVFKVEPANGNQQTTLTNLDYPRGAYDDAQPIHDVAAAPGGDVYLAGDPDGSAPQFTDGIYKVGTTPGTFELISSVGTANIAITPEGDIVGFRDVPTNSSTGKYTFFKIDPDTKQESTLSEIDYTRGVYGDFDGTRVHDIAAGANGAVYFAGDPDGGGNAANGDGIYKLGSTPGTFTQISSTPTDRIAATANGDLVGLRTSEPTDTTGRAAVVTINPITKQETPLNEYNFPRGSYEPSSLYAHDVAAAPSGAIYVAGDLDGNGAAQSQGIFTVGSTPGSFTKINNTPTFDLAVVPNTLTNTLAGDVVGAFQPQAADLTTRGAVFKVDPDNGNQHSTLTELSYPRGSYGENNTPVHDVAAGPGGEVYLAGDPDGSSLVSPQQAYGIYKVGTTPGSLELISSIETIKIAVSPTGDIIGLRDVPSSSTTGRYTIVRIDPNTKVETKLQDYDYVRGAYDGFNGTTLHDVAAGPNGAVYVTGDPDGSAATFGDGIFRVGTTPGAFTQVSGVHADRIAATPGGDILALRTTDLSETTFKATIVRINPNTSAETPVNEFTLPRGSYEPGSTYAHDVASGPTGDAFFAGDLDGNGSAQPDGIYLIGTTPGTFTRLSSVPTFNLGVFPTQNEVTLSSTSVPEFRPTGTVVGTLGTIEPGSGHTFTYTLVPGTGSTDNAAFTISGNELRTNDAFDFAAKSSYSVRVRSTDENNFVLEKAFAISILDDTRLTRSGSTLTVSGSVGNDTFSFAANSVRHSMTLNGSALAANAAAVSNILFQGNGGNDAATLFATGSNNLAQLFPKNGTLSGSGYLVNAQNPNGNLSLFAIGGNTDTALLYDDTAGDPGFFFATPTFSNFANASGSYVSQANNFRTVFGVANPSNGATALLNGAAAGTNAFSGGPGVSNLSDGASYTIQANDFRTVYGVSQGGGSDLAFLSAPATGTNTFVGNATVSNLGDQSATYLVQANSFRTVYGISPANPNNVAYLQAPATGTNSFSGNLQVGVSLLAGANYLVQANFFKTVYGLSNGGNDAAYLTAASSGTSTLVGSATVTNIAGNGFLFQVNNFRSVFGFNNGGTTQAFLIAPSTGTNSFVADTNGISYLQGANYLVQVGNFQAVTAFGQNGPDNIAYLKARTTQDVLNAQGAAATLSGPGYVVAAQNFPAVLAFAVTGGKNKVNRGMISYFLGLIPPQDWE